MSLSTSYTAESQATTSVSPTHASREQASPASDGSDFLGTLPEAGRYVIQELKGTTFLKPKFFDTKREALDYAQNYQGDNSVFHGIATYGDKDNRKGDNTVAFRSFVLDVDTSENTGKQDDKKFPTKKAAIEFVRDTLEKLNFPAPNHVVETSAGVHLYWKIDCDLSPEEWLAIAKRLKSFFKNKLGKAAVDVSRVSDLVRHQHL